MLKGSVKGFCVSDLLKILVDVQSDSMSLTFQIGEGQSHTEMREQTFQKNILLMFFDQ